MRSQLIVLLKNKVFNEYEEFWEKPLSINMFRNEYPRYPTIEQVVITDEEKTYTIDLRPFMNPSPYTVQHVSSLYVKIFLLCGSISNSCNFFLCSLPHCQEHSDFLEH